MVSTPTLERGEDQGDQNQQDMATGKGKDEYLTFDRLESRLRLACFISRQFSNLRWLNVLVHPISLHTSLIPGFSPLFHTVSDGKQGRAWEQGYLHTTTVNCAIFTIFSHSSSDSPYVCVDLELTLGWVGSVS